MPNIYGGNGDETLNGTDDRDLIYGRDGDDTLNGGGGNDVLYGGAGSDSMYGGEGDDQLSGGEGGDRMEGGNGNDTYFVDDNEDVVVEFSAGGVDRVVSYLANYRMAANIELLDLAEGAGNGTGNELNNVMRGNSTNNLLQGMGGNDQIGGQGGDDIINGGFGDDFLDGGAGSDTISFKTTTPGGATIDLANTTTRQNTGFGNDLIRNFENIEGTFSNDVLLGDGADNAISALSGDDFIRGRGGNDNITAGTGADTIAFEAAGAANGVDRIRAFETGVDKLQFSSADYSSSATLTYGTAAVGAGAQFVFDDVLDQLYYDADGAGGAAAILIANLYQTTLASGDIVIV